MRVALALFRFTYRGYNNKYSWADRTASITAATAALGVAFFPTAAPDCKLLFGADYSNARTLALRKIFARKILLSAIYIKYKQGLSGGVYDENRNVLSLDGCVHDRL
jgi:hypothetical protein